MGIDGCESGRPNAWLVFGKFDVGFRFFFVDIAFGKAKIDDVNGPGVIVQTHDKIVRFDVSVEHGLLAGFMEHFQTVNELYKDENSGLKRKSLTAEVVQVS